KTELHVQLKPGIFGVKVQIMPPDSIFPDKITLPPQEAVTEASETPPVGQGEEAVTEASETPPEGQGGEAEAELQKKEQKEETAE
ncbi:MAG: hypothetical protein JSV64_03980, partial [Candidatus Bathyarchaeota archaeon]